MVFFCGVGIHYTIVEWGKCVPKLIKVSQIYFGYFFPQFQCFKKNNRIAYASENIVASIIASGALGREGDVLKKCEVGKTKGKLPKYKFSKDIVFRFINYVYPLFNYNYKVLGQAC